MTDPALDVPDAVTGEPALDRSKMPTHGRPARQGDERTERRHGWKILTHDGRSPLQRGPSLLSGSFPITLPTVPLDTGTGECAAGWNYVGDIPAGWRITGLWRTGRPTRVIRVEASADAIQRGAKRRASSLTLVREATAEERWSALVAFSSVFGVHQERMAREQAAWWHALGRPHHEVAEVERQLVRALSAYGLPWKLKRYDDAAAAWSARAAMWGAAGVPVWATDWGDAWGAWDVLTARTDGDTRNAAAAWAAAPGDAGVAWAAGAAWAALFVLYARLMDWQEGDPEQYTVGIREAYEHGLAVALPVGPTTLGWAMEETGSP